MLLNSIVGAALITMGSVAFAEFTTPASEMEVGDEPRYTDIGKFEDVFPHGESSHSVAFQNPLNAMDISFWHNVDFRCNGVELKTVSVKTAADQVEPAKVASRYYRGTYYYSIPEGVKSIHFTAHNSSLITQHCTIAVKKPNFRVPVLFEGIIRVETPRCEQGSTTNCSYSVVRIDDSSNHIYAVSGQDYSTFNFKPASFYRITGFVDLVNGAELLAVESSIKVME